MDDWIVIDDLRIPLTELEFKFSRSGGQGGQHVNKVSTRVELYFSIPGSKVLPDAVKTILAEKLKKYCTATGTIRIVSQESRSQWKNRESAVERFESLLRRALHRKEERLPTKPTSRSKTSRLDKKKQRGNVKKARRKISGDEG